MPSIYISAAMALIAGSAAIAQDSKPAKSADRFDMPSYERPAEAWRSVENGLPIDPERCAEKIRQVRAESGKPALEGGSAEPKEPLLIAAVQQKIDGCSVLVMHDDTSDVRPVPASGPARMVPVPAD